MNGKTVIGIVDDRVTDNELERIHAAGVRGARFKRTMNDAEEVELLYRYVDGDKTLLQKILVDNPTRLHRFAS